MDDARQRMSVVEALTNTVRQVRSDDRPLSVIEPKQAVLITHMVQATRGTGVN